MITYSLPIPTSPYFFGTTPPSRTSELYRILCKMNPSGASKSTPPLPRTGSLFTLKTTSSFGTSKTQPLPHTSQDPRPLTASLPPKTHSFRPTSRASFINGKSNTAQPFFVLILVHPVLPQQYAQPATPVTTSQLQTAWYVLTNALPLQFDLIILGGGQRGRIWGS